MSVDPEMIKGMLSTMECPLLTGIQDSHLLLVRQKLMWDHAYRHLDDCRVRPALAGSMATLVAYVTHLEATVQLIDDRTDGAVGWSTFREMLPPATAQKARDN